MSDGRTYSDEAQRTDSPWDFNVPFTIVLGNTKGGTGKSTIALHLIVALLKAGYRVGSIDLDLRQASLSHYLGHRQASADSGRRDILVPRHIHPDSAEAMTQVVAAARRALRAAYEKIGAVDIVVVDTPGAETVLSKLVHELADVLITPVNDSLMDLDVLADIDPVNRQVTAPSRYTQQVWEMSNRRVAAGQPPIDWIIVRNRLSHMVAHNTADITRLLGLLATRIGLRVAPELRERVVYRELFLEGLTSLDLPAATIAGSPSRRAAQQEILDLVRFIGLQAPDLHEQGRSGPMLSYAFPAA